MAQKGSIAAKMLQKTNEMFFNKVKKGAFSSPKGKNKEVKREIKKSIADRIIDKISRAERVNLGDILDEIEQEDDEEGPRLTRDDGRVRAISFLSDGFIIGDAVIPWPSLKVWLKIPHLNLAQRAYMNYHNLKAHIAGLTVAPEKGYKENQYRKILSDIVRDYKESGVKFDITGPLDMPYNMLYALFHKRHLEDLENSRIPKNKPWLYQKMKREINNTHSNMLYRKRTVQELNWLNKYIEPAMVKKFVEYVIPVIAEWLSRKELNPKKVKMP